MTTLDWDTLRSHLDSGDQVAVAKAFAGVDDRTRRALTEPLKSYARELNRQPETYPEQRGWRTARGQRVAPLRVAILGCLTGADAAAKWLARPELWTGYPRIDGLPIVLRTRRADWVADMVTRFAGRIKRTDFYLYEVAVALVREAGVAPPATDGFVTAWVNGASRLQLAEDALGRLRADPLLTAVVPLLFDVDSIGPFLELDTADGTPMWPTWLATLAAEGVLDRAILLDGCLRRMLRGGKANALRGYVRVFTGLAPTTAELRRHIPDLLQLLPDAAPPVAALAQRELRSLEEAGELDPADLAEAGRSVLSRTEKNILTAQLSWLDTVAKRDKERAGDVVTVVTELFADRPVDLQRRAVTITLRYLGACPDDVRETVRAAAATLPGDLRDKIAAAVGTVEAEPVFDLPAPAPAPANRREMPPPIASPEELAEELAALLPPILQTYNTDTVGVERVFAALVRFAADRTALRAALQPVLTRFTSEPGLPRTRRISPDDGFLAVLSAAVAGPKPRKPGVGITSVERELKWRSAALGAPAPYRVLLYRMHEIADRLAHAPVPALVATPTLTTGHLDPEVLLARLETAAAEGWEPAEYDLQQALLRIPRNTYPDLAKRATKVGTPAADRLAAHLLAPLPDPDITRVDVAIALTKDHRGEHQKIRVVRPVIQTSSGDVPEGKYAPEVRQLPSSLADLLWHLPSPRYMATTGDVSWWASSWSAVAPGHRDVIAAHLTRFLAAEYPPVDIGTALLNTAETDGPLGTGTALAVAFSVGSPDRTLRAYAVDTLITLHANGWDATTTGSELGALAATETISLARAVPTLRSAADAGAATTIWTAIAAALPAVLTTTPKRTADLLVLATELAERLQIRAPIPAVTDAANALKSTRARTEARRLNALLNNQS